MRSEMVLIQQGRDVAVLFVARWFVDKAIRKLTGRCAQETGWLIEDAWRRYCRAKHRLTVRREREALTEWEMSLTA